MPQLRYKTVSKKAFEVSGLSCMVVSITAAMTAMLNSLIQMFLGGIDAEVHQNAIHISKMNLQPVCTLPYRALPHYHSLQQP